MSKDGEGNDYSPLADRGSDMSVAGSPWSGEPRVPAACRNRSVAFDYGKSHGWPAGRRRNKMARYLISFDDGTMIIPEEDLPAVGEASHRVVDEAKAAGVWIFGGGVLSQRASIVATDGTVTDGPIRRPRR